MRLSQTSLAASASPKAKIATSRIGFLLIISFHHLARLGHCLGCSCVRIVLRPRHLDARTLLLAFYSVIEALMPLVGGLTASLPSPVLIKMEERKRPAGDDESAPPLKRQATSVNGASKPHIDADMLYQDDLEVSLARTSFLILPAFALEDPIFSQVVELTAFPNSASRRRQYGARCKSTSAIAIPSRPS